MRLDGEGLAEVVLDEEARGWIEGEIMDEIGGRSAVECGLGLPRENVDEAPESCDVLPRAGIELLPRAVQEDDCRQARSVLERQSEPGGVAL